MKTVIVTMQSRNNYGQRLQNYAAFYILQRLNLNPYTFKIVYSKTIKERAKYIYYRILKFVDKRFILQNKKEKLFDLFNSEYLNFNILNSKKISRLNSFDYIFTGSDQVWNPFLDKKELDVFFLEKIEDDKKKCMCPSLGVDEIPTELNGLYKEYLSHFKEISVREETGKKAITKLYDGKVVRLVDPTLYVGKKIWEQLENDRYNLPTDKYLFYFFLDENKLVYENAKEFCKKNNYIFLDINILNSDANTIVGPREWLRIIDKADIVVTDSFHGVAFSIIYEKNFWAYDRNYSIYNQKESRVKQIMSLFRLRDRFNNKISEKSIDYELTKKILYEEKEKWNDFLKCQQLV